MIIRFSPASEFTAPDCHGPVTLGGVSDDRPASGARGTSAGSISGFQKRFSNASTRFLISARSALESGKLTQPLIDVFTLAFGAGFLLLLFASICGAFFILFSNVR